MARPDGSTSGGVSAKPLVERGRGWSLVFSLFPLHCPSPFRTIALAYIKGNWALLGVQLSPEGIKHTVEHCSVATRSYYKQGNLWRASV